MKMKTLSLMILLCSSLYVYGQQEQMVTQFMYNKMSLNPAFAGHEKYTGITMMVRDQWNGFPGAPKTQMLSVNLPRFSNKLGVGFNLRNNQIGIFRNLTYSGIYSYKFLFGEGTLLSMGIELSGRNIVSDFGNKNLLATQGLENDPSIPNEKITENLFNVGYGLYFSTNRFYIGASVPRLIKNSLDFDGNKTISEEERHLFVMTGTAFTVNRDLSIQTQALLKFAQNSPFDIDLNATATLNEKYTGGFTYRFGGANGDIGESIDLLFGFKVTEKWLIGFSNDFTLSKIRRFDNGSLELIMQYDLGKKKNRVVVVNPRYF